MKKPKMRLREKTFECGECGCIFRIREDFCHEEGNGILSTTCPVCRRYCCTGENILRASGTDEGTPL